MKVLVFFFKINFQLFPKKVEQIHRKGKRLFLPLLPANALEKRKDSNDLQREDSNLEHL